MRIAAGPGLGIYNPPSENTLLEVGGEEKEGSAKSLPGGGSKESKHTRPPLPLEIPYGQTMGGG